MQPGEKLFERKDCAHSVPVAFHPAHVCAYDGAWEMFIGINSVETEIFFCQALKARACKPHEHVSP